MRLLAVIIKQRVMDFTEMQGLRSPIQAGFRPQIGRQACSNLQKHVTFRSLCHLARCTWFSMQHVTATSSTAMAAATADRQNHDTYDPRTPSKGAKQYKY